MQTNPNPSNPSQQPSNQSSSQPTPNPTSNNKVTIDGLKEEKLLRGDIATLIKDSGDLVRKEYGSLGSFLTETQKKIFELDNGAISLAKTFGQGRNAVQSLKDSVADSIPLLIALGEKPTKAFEDLAKISEQVGRNLKLDPETIDSFIVIEKVLGITPQNLIDGFQNAGMSVRSIGSEMEKVQTYLSGVGVPVQKVAQTVAANLDKMSLYTFENGVEGLAKMAAKASVMKFDISKAFEMSDKLMDPTQALEFSNSLQRLGITTTALIDPLRSMQMAFYEPDQLMVEMGNMLTNMATLNKESNKFEINPLARMQMMELAQSSGIPVQNLQKMAIQQAKLVEQGKSFISSVNFPKLSIGDVDEKTETLLRNVAELNEKGEWSFNVKEGDKMVQKTSMELTEENLAYLKKSQEDAGKSLEELALEQRNILDGIYQTLQSQVQRPGYALATSQPVGKGLDLTSDMMKNLFTSVDKQETFKISKLSNQVDQFGDIFAEMIKDINEGKNIFEIFSNMGDRAKPLIQFLDGIPKAAGDTMSEFADKMKQTNSIFDSLVGTSKNLYEMFRSQQDKKGKESTSTPENTAIIKPVKDGIFADVYQTLPEDNIYVTTNQPTDYNEKYEKVFKTFEDSVNKKVTDLDFSKITPKPLPTTVPFNNEDTLTDFAKKLSETISNNKNIRELKKEEKQETASTTLTPEIKLPTKQETPIDLPIRTFLDKNSISSLHDNLIDLNKNREIKFEITSVKFSDFQNEITNFVKNNQNLPLTFIFKFNDSELKTQVSKIEDEYKNTKLTITPEIGDINTIEISKGVQKAKDDVQKDKVEIPLTTKIEDNKTSDQINQLKTKYESPVTFKVGSLLESKNVETEIDDFKKKNIKQMVFGLKPVFDKQKTEKDIFDFDSKIKDLKMNFNVNPKLTSENFDKEYEPFKNKFKDPTDILIQPKLGDTTDTISKFTDFKEKYIKGYDINLKTNNDFDKSLSQYNSFLDQMKNVNIDMNTNFDTTKEKNKFNDFISQVDNKVLDFSFNQEPFKKLTESYEGTKKQIEITPPIQTTAELKVNPPTENLSTKLTAVVSEVRDLEKIQPKGINLEPLLPKEQPLLPKTRSEFLSEKNLTNEKVAETTNAISNDRLVEILMKNKEENKSITPVTPVSTNIQLKPETMGPQFNFEKLNKEPSVARTENVQKVEGKVTLDLSVNGSTIKEFDLANALRYGNYGQQIGKIVEQAFKDGLVPDKMQQFVS